MSMASIDALGRTSLKLSGETEAAVLEFLAAAAEAPIVPADPFERVPVGLVYKEIGVGIFEHLCSAILVFLAEAVPSR